MTVSDAVPNLPLLASPSIATVVTALARAQAHFAPIEKAKRANISTRTGSSFSYTYADLATVLQAVRQPLAENELALLQPVQMTDGTLSVMTAIVHSSGEWVGAKLDIPLTDPTDVRAVASSVTYLRRYGLLSLLAIAPADEDDDAAAATHDHPASAETTARPVRRATKPHAAQDDDDPVISVEDRSRLFKLAEKGGWSTAALKSYLFTTFHVERTEQLRQSQYDAIVSRLFTEPPPPRGGLNHAAVPPLSSATAPGPEQTSTTTAATRGLISESQRRRMFAIAKKSGWSSAALHELLATRYDILSTSAVPADNYDAICRNLEDAPRSSAPTREPGEEG